MALRFFVMFVFSFFVTVNPFCMDAGYVSKKGPNCQ